MAISLFIRYINSVDLTPLEKEAITSQFHHEDINIPFPPLIRRNKSLFMKHI